MNTLKLSFLALLAAAPLSATAQVVVNIDFLEQRGSQSPASNYSGSGPSPLSEGSVYNGLAANDSSDGDNITVAGTGLEDSTGLPSSAGFSISSVGADNEPSLTTFGVVNTGYLFLNASNNSKSSVDFSFSGLGVATTANVYFTTSNSPGNAAAVFTFASNATPETFTHKGIFTAANTYEFEVPVVNGQVNGTFGGQNGGLVLLSAVTIEANGIYVPEPSTYGLGLAGLLLLAFLIRQRKAGA